jgi:hypothetical protein
MGFNISVEKSSNRGSLQAALKKIANKAVYVGIPAGSNRKNRGVTNAELLYIQSKGSPVKNIPARPVLEPAIEANAESIAAEIAAATAATLMGDEAGQLRALKRAGLAGQNAARGWFTDSRNGWPANSPETIRRKGSDQPLIDTSQMRKAITFVIVDEGGESQNQNDEPDEQDEQDEENQNPPEPGEPMRPVEATGEAVGEATEAAAETGEAVVEAGEAVVEVVAEVGGTIAEAGGAALLL